MLSFSYLHVISFGLEHKIYKFNSLSNILSSYVIVNLKVASITRPFVLCIHLNFSWKLAILNISMWWLGNKHFLFYLLFYAAWWFLNCFFFLYSVLSVLCVLNSVSHCLTIQLTRASFASWRQPTSPDLGFAAWYYALGYIISTHSQYHSCVLCPFWLYRAHNPCRD